MPKKVSGQQALKLLPEDYASVIAEEVPESPRDAADLAEDEAIRLQAMSGGVTVLTDGKTLARRVPFEGKEFAIADKVGLMPLMEFAYHANSGLDTSDLNALAAIYEMLKDCIHEKEWPRFVRHAKETKAGAEEMMPVVQATIELLTANPTGQGSDSSEPSHATSGSLTDTSSGQRDQLIPVGELGKLASLR